MPFLKKIGSGNLLRPITYRSFSSFPETKLKLPAMLCVEASSIAGQSGRWSKTASGSLVASWASASVAFLFSGSRLSVSFGQETDRIDKNNGGTPMIAVITGSEQESALSSPSNWRTFDPTPGSEIAIIEEAAGTTKPHKKTFVKIVLIDWASKLELEAFILDEVTFLLPLEFTSIDMKPPGRND